MQNKKYFCDCNHCKYASFYENGDGWNEPFSYEFDCNANIDPSEDADFTDNSEDELCLYYIEADNDLGDWDDFSDEEIIDDYSHEYIDE